MKKFLILLAIAITGISGCKKFDDSKLWNSIGELDKRVEALEEFCNKMNANISSLQSIVKSLEAKEYVTNVVDLPNGEGYIISFTSGKIITIYHGNDGHNGTDGTTPAISVKKDTDGIYYWTVNNDWLIVDGHRVKATGDNGSNGTDGSDGVTPSFKIENDYWYISYDDGESWEQLGKATGNDGSDGVSPKFKIKDGSWYVSYDNGMTWTEIGKATGENGSNGSDGSNGTDGKDGADGKDGITPQLKIEDDYWYVSYDNKETWEKLNKATGADGDSIFLSVSQDDNNAYFTLKDGTVITIPKGSNDKSEFAILFNTTDIILNGGESKTINYTIKGANENTTIKAIPQNGWEAVVYPISIDKGSITITAPDPVVYGEIIVLANDGSSRTIIMSLNCIQGEMMMIDDSIEASPEGGAYPVRLITNTNYSIEIPEDAQSWISILETRAMQKETINFNIAPNNNFRRSATIFLKGDAGNILQTIIVQQLGVTPIIHVETPGNLENLLEKYNYVAIESLKISGILNDVDFKFIKKAMPSLKNLDIAEVELSELPTGAFEYSRNVEDLILPLTLITIGEYMFQHSNIKTITIPPSVETIKKSAFFQCHYLKSIVIPASVETIENEAFYGCGLQTIIFEEGSQLRTISGGYWSNAYDSPIGVFTNCRSLTSIEIPASVETIEASAFRGCTSLQTVTFEKGSKLRTIGGGHWSSNSYGAFTGCKSLTSIEIPANVETIDAGAFSECSKLHTVTFEKKSRLKTIGGTYYNSSNHFGAFSYCPALTSIEIPASVETIDICAFSNCFNLHTITFEKNSRLKTIGGGVDSKEYYGAFSDCGLVIIDMSTCTEISKINKGAFANNTKLNLFKIGTIRPPDLGYEDFFSSCKLKVPMESVDTYKSVTAWQNFSSITGLDE